MRPVLQKLKPTSGFAHFMHIGLLVVLPLAVFVLVRLNFVQLALSLIVLSKWRMLAVRPRFWPANIRANAIDLMVGLSVVVFMTHDSGLVLQLTWAALYAAWLLVIKPATGIAMVTIQASIGQLVALVALYLIWADGPVYGLTLLTGLICFLAARHFFDTFEEPYAKMLSYVWGYFGAALAWLLSHMLIAYPNGDSNTFTQPVILLSAVGYGVGVLYYLDHNDRLSRGVRRQVLTILFMIVSALVVSLYLRTKHLIA